MKAFSHRQALIVVTLGILLVSCGGGSSSEAEAVPAGYTAEAPVLSAIGADSGEVVELDVVDVEGAVVDVH